MTPALRDPAMKLVDFLLDWNRLTAREFCTKYPEVNRAGLYGGVLDYAMTLAKEVEAARREETRT